MEYDIENDVVINDKYDKKLRHFLQQCNLPEKIYTYVHPDGNWTTDHEFRDFHRKSQQISLIKNYIYSKKIKELNEPNISSLTENQWDTLKVVVVNYLHTYSIKDFKAFYEYYNSLNF
jgi:hypothetical protein